VSHITQPTRTRLVTDLTVLAGPPAAEHVEAAPEKPVRDPAASDDDRRAAEPRPRWSAAVGKRRTATCHRSACRSLSNLTLMPVYAGRRPPPVRSVACVFDISDVMSAGRTERCGLSAGPSRRRPGEPLQLASRPFAVASERSDVGGGATATVRPDRGSAESGHCHPGHSCCACEWHAPRWRGSPETAPWCGASGTAAPTARSVPIESVPPPHFPSRGCHRLPEPVGPNGVGGGTRIADRSRPI